MAERWLETERLALRRFTLDDLDTLARLNADSRVMQYLGGVKDRAATAVSLRTRILDYYDQHPGLGTWATIERATGAPVGFHVLNHIQGEIELQVGYALFPDFWGRGFATEMTTALLHHGYGTLRLPQINAITDLGNTASQQVLRKAGLVRNGERAFAHPAYAASGPMAWFESHCEPWLAWVDKDVGIRGDRIAHIGDLHGATATARLDASGLVVAPGFVDPHVHARERLFELPTEPKATSSRG